MRDTGDQRISIVLQVNGEEVHADVEPRLLLTDFLRHEVGLTGTKVGCEHGVCGACTILLDGDPIRACLMFAVQAAGHEIQTVESLATGMIGLAEGTDLGGSLRIPAAFCGVVGLRPTPGLIPTWPSDYSWDTMQVTGLMARRAEDLAVALQAVAGPSPLAPVGQFIDLRDFAEAVASRPVEGMRLAYCSDIAGIGVDAGVDTVCRAAVQALEDAGARVEEIELDLSYARSAFLALRGHWMVAQQLGRLDRMAEFGDNLRSNVEAGLATDALELAQAEAVRGQVWDQFRALLQTFDHLLTPTMAIAPFAVEQSYPDTIAGKPMETYIDWVAPTFLLSLTGLPIVSVPAGVDTAGLPVGLQIVGAPAAEGQVLAAAARLQELRPLPAPAMLTG